MAKVAFTAGRVSGFKCPPDKQQAFLWDSTTPGLGLRMTPTGKPAYIFQGEYMGKSVRIAIGSPDAWSIPQAQAKARELQRLIDEGTDPRSPKREALAAAAAEEQAQAAAIAQAVTVGEIWPQYLANGKPKRKEAWKPRYRADLEAMAAPGGEPKKRGQGVTRPGPLYPLLALPLAGVTEDALQVWFEREAQAGRHQATRALMMFRGFLRWCASRPEYRALTDRDAGKAPAIVENLAPSTTRRTDCLEAAQVAAWWQCVDELGNRTASAYLRALLLTGARREEVAALTWANVDFQWRKLTIADKASDSRTIPLSPYLAQLLATLPRQGPFVFASTGKAGRITDARASHATALQRAGIGHLTFHGLRRSFSLLGEAAGAPAGAIAQIMGHRPSAVAEGYRPRSIDALRPYSAQIEAHILALAGVQLDAQAEPGKLRIVAHGNSQ
jgi:integrase